MAETEPDRELETLRCALDGDDSRLTHLLESYRARLRRMVQLRMDPRVQGRVDASDVIQETYLDVASQLEQFVGDPRIPFFLWVRFIAGRKLGEAHRRHLGTHKRDARREISMERSVPDATSAYIAGALVDGGLSPSQVVSQNEQKGILERALDTMRPNDREILALRHYEQLGNSEVAVILDITPSAANVRYVRAIRRLKSAFDRLQSPGP